MSAYPSPHHSQSYGPHPSPSKALPYHPGPHSSPHGFPTSTDTSRSDAQNLAMVESCLGQVSPSRQSQQQGERAEHHYQREGEETRQKSHVSESGQWIESHQQLSLFQGVEYLQAHHQDHSQDHSHQQPIAPVNHLPPPGQGGNREWVESYQQGHPPETLSNQVASEVQSQAQAHLPPPGQGHANHSPPSSSAAMPAAPMQPEQEQEQEQEFDPMAPVELFDSKGELESKWNEMQDEMVPFLQSFANEALSNTFDMILQAHLMYHQLNARVQKEFVEGVKAIENEEDKQEEARKVITDFSNEMKRAAEVLKRFGSPEVLRNAPQ
ncbi:hypothetical protein IAR50_000979 [Cryptococcus sp. DSM 104548]